MCTPQINCFCPERAGAQPLAFYLLSKGNNAGQPNLSPWVNSFAVYCESKEEQEFYFWVAYSLWQTGRFKQFLRGSVVPFLSVNEARHLIRQTAARVYPHWQSLMPVLEALNKLKAAKAHLAQCIIANERLQKMLLQAHF